MKNTKYLIVVLLLIFSIAFKYIVPKTKYVGTNFISSLSIPLAFPGWLGKNQTSALNINLTESKFNFINDALAYQYKNNNNQNLLFIVLDAGNFHHPQVCFTSSGYTTKELPATEFHLSDRTIMAHTLLTQKEREDNLSFYWITIDKKIAHNWIEQKFKQLYFSTINKKRIGLMIRIDIPITNDNIEESTLLAQQFIQRISHATPPEQADYIFGKKIK